MTKLTLLAPGDDLGSVLVPKSISEDGKLTPETQQAVHEMVAKSARIFEILATTEVQPISSKTGKAKKPQPFHERIDKIALDKAGEGNEDRARNLSEEIKVGIWFVLAGHMLANKGLVVGGDDEATAENLKPVLDRVMQAMNHLPHAEFIEEVSSEAFLSPHLLGNFKQSPKVIIDNTVAAVRTLKERLEIEALRSSENGGLTQARMVKELIEESDDFFEASLKEKIEERGPESFRGLLKKLYDLRFKDPKNYKKPVKELLKKCGMPSDYIPYIIEFLRSDNFLNCEAAILEKLYEGLMPKLAFDARKARAHFFPAKGFARGVPFMREIPAYMTAITDRRVSSIPFIARGFTREFEAEQLRRAAREGYEAINLGDSEPQPPNHLKIKSWEDVRKAVIENGTKDTKARMREMGMEKLFESLERKTIKAMKDRVKAYTRIVESIVLDSASTKAMLQNEAERILAQVLPFPVPKNLIEDLVEASIQKSKKRKASTKALRVPLQKLVLGASASAALEAEIQALKTELGPQTQGISTTAQEYLKGEPTAPRSNLVHLIFQRPVFIKNGQIEQRIAFLEEDVSQFDSRDLESKSILLGRAKLILVKLNEALAKRKTSLSRTEDALAIAQREHAAYQRFDKRDQAGAQEKLDNLLSEQSEHKDSISGLEQLKLRVETFIVPLNS